MSGGTFSKCPACDRLNIYGARGVCGQRTDMPLPTTPPTVATEGDGGWGRG